MFPSQSNTQPGSRRFVAGADLTGLEGRLVVVANSAGSNIVNKVAALTDVPVFVLVDGGIAAADVTVEPLDTDSNRRVRLKSTCVAGDVLVLADPGTAADAGKVRKLPATAGAYVQVGIAEETGVDGQLVLLRPLVRIVNVKSADSITGAADLAALKVVLLAILEAQGLVV